MSVYKLAIFISHLPVEDHSIVAESSSNYTISGQRMTPSLPNKDGRRNT